MSRDARGNVENLQISERPLRSDANNRAPLYHQIYLILRSRIMDGSYGAGALLPGEREIETMFQVSRITAVRALNELAAAGLVVRERGRGTRVLFGGKGTVNRGPTGEDDDGAVRVGRDIFDPLRSDGRTGAAVIEFDYVDPTPDVMRALGLSPGERAQRAARVWSFDDKPFNYVTTYVPESIGKAWTRADMEVTPLAGLLERSGVEVSLVRERVTATLTDTHLSSYLGVEVGSPVLKIYRTAFDPAGRAVEYLIGFYRPDRYQYEVELPR